MSEYFTLSSLESFPVGIVIIPGISFSRSDLIAGPFEERSIITDEVVIFDDDDPDNDAAPPDDGDTIEVTYYSVNTNQLMVELFMVLSSNHAKLVAAQNIMGVQMDLKSLSDAFYDQSVRWAV